MKKKKVAVLFGGRNSEHDISVITAIQLMGNMDPMQYDVVPIYIDREGVWYTGEFKDIEAVKSFSPDDARYSRCFLPPVPTEAALCYWPEKKLLGGGGKNVISEIDVAIPVFHGMNGEDGTIQGLLELANIPYTSASVLGCAISMDKYVMKLLFRGMGLRVLPGILVERAELQSMDAVAARVEEALRYPVFVKPANLGSSIGISRVKDRGDLMEALEIAASYDRRILVEQGMTEMVEINCSVLGMGHECIPSLLEMPMHWEEFLTFDEKYLRGLKSGRGQGMKSLERQLPAPISDEMTTEIQDISMQVFRAMDLKGVVRIDYIVDKRSEEVYINEVNSIPGSMAFYLWEPSGMTYPKLIEAMILYAEQAHAERNKNVFTFDSQVLEKVDLKGSKGAKG